MSTPGQALERTTDRTEILERLRQLAADAAGLDLNAVLAESDLDQDLGMDSLTRIEFAMAVEEAYGLELSDEATAGIRTVADAADAVGELLQA